MESLAANNFVATGKLQQVAPSHLYKLAPEAAAKLLPTITPEIAEQYRDSWECTQFLDGQEAWPNVTMKQMYGHIASNKCVTFIHRNREGEMDAAAVLKVCTMHNSIVDSIVENVTSLNERLTQHVLGSLRELSACLLD